MSEFKFACPVCGQHIKSHSSASGTQIECPTCFQKIVVPQAPTDESTKYILSATQAPGKRPVTTVSDTTTIALQRPRWRLVLWGALLVLVSVVVGVGLVLSGTIKLRPAPATQLGTNVQKPDLATTTTDPRWRLNLSEAQIPTNSANGRIWGRTFQLQRATFEEGILALRQGPTWPPDVGVTIVLPKRPVEDYAGKEFFIPTNFAGQAPRVVLRIKDDQQKEVTTNYRSGYAMKLEFGHITGEKLPGRIYLCMPDDSKSVVVGSFQAEIRIPHPR